MKSERRHELQHNELAEWIAKAALAIKPYQNMLFGGVLAVLVIVAGYAVWARMAADEAAKAWDDVNAVLDSGDVLKLSQVIEDYPRTSAAYMAGLVLADNYLGEGCNRLFTNKASGFDELNKAIRLYDAVREECRIPSLLERATFGLARAKEAKGDDKSLKQAEQLYEEVAKKKPSGAFTAAANQRLADLKQPSTKVFYDQFCKFDPKPAFSKPNDQFEFDSKNLPAEGSTEMPPSKLKLKPKAQADAKPAAEAKPEKAKEDKPAKK
jgi:predicted negative regulator of RcsB-dependent stress response